MVMIFDYTKIKPAPQNIGRFKPIKPEVSNRLVIETELGELEFLLFPEVAPKTVAQIQEAVGSGYYEGCEFYRFERNFVIQGGCHFVHAKEPLPKLPLEYKKPNAKGFVSMARTADPGSATSEFAIQLKDNSKWLGPGGSDEHGYAVFMELKKGGYILEQMLDAHDLDENYRLKFLRVYFK